MNDKRKNHPLPTPDAGHFNCLKCEMLNLPVDLQCPTCKLCYNGHCRCKLCRKCGVKHKGSGFCSVCGLCRTPNIAGTHCTCSKRPALMKNLARPVSTPSPTLSRLLTCEIEVADRGSFAVGASGKFMGVPLVGIADGSIPNAGKEYIFGPGSGKDYLSALSGIARAFETHRVSVNRQCGLHVHVDGRDFNAWSARRLLVMYERLKPQIYKLVLPERAKVNYSLMGEKRTEWVSKLISQPTSSLIRKQIVESVYKVADQSSVPRRASKYDSARYTGLNLHSWFHRGTFEWRMHHGTVDPTRLLMWPQLCGWFTDLAYHLSDRDAFEITTLPQLLHGSWKVGPYLLQMPREVATWVEEELESPDFGTPIFRSPRVRHPLAPGIFPPPLLVEDEENETCPRCEYDPCECCDDCNRYPCEC